MKNYLAIIVLLVQCSLFAFPAPLQRSRWTTNTDATIVSGSTLTNIPQAAVTGLTTSYQATNAALTGFQTLGTNAFYNTNANLQAGSTALTNWSLHTTNEYTSTNVFATFTNQIGTAAFKSSNFFQPASSTLTNWSLYSTNSFYNTNANLQAGSTTLSNFNNLGTNAWIPYGASLTKGEFPIYNGTNWTTQDPPAGTSVLTYNVTTGTGGSWVSVVDPSNLGTGSSLTNAILYRDGTWRVPSGTVSTNSNVFNPGQFVTNVDSAITIKSGATVTNLQAQGTTATSDLTAATIEVGDLDAAGLSATSIQAGSIHTEDLTATNVLLITVAADDITTASLTSTTISSGSTFTEDLTATNVSLVDVNVSSSITFGGVTRTNWPTGGSGSQTPIAQDVNYAGYSVTNMNNLGATNVVFPATGLIQFGESITSTKASIYGETNTFEQPDLVFKTGEGGVERLRITGAYDPTEGYLIVVTNCTLKIADGSGLLLNGLVSIRPASSSMLSAPSTGVTLLSFKTNTTDNTTNTIGTIDLAGSHAISVVATFIGVDDSDNVATYIRRAQFVNGGGITQKGSTATLGVDYEDAGAAAWGVIVEGDGIESALIEVYGDTAQNVSWTVSVQVTTAN